jgi:hypothetical protein
VRTEERLYVAWVLCVADHRDHAVTDEEFATGVRRQRGRFEAVCGHTVTPGSMLMPPGSPCRRCAAYLRALATLRDAEQRMNPHRHRKPTFWSRLRGTPEPPAIPQPREHSHAVSPERDSRATAPAGAGSAPIAPASAGRHHLREGR